MSCFDGPALALGFILAIDSPGPLVAAASSVHASLVLAQMEDAGRFGSHET